MDLVLRVHELSALGLIAEDVIRQDVSSSDLSWMAISTNMVIA